MRIARKKIGQDMPESTLVDIVQDPLEAKARKVGMEEGKPLPSGMCSVDVRD